MARLTNTLINGSLKVTDNIYANLIQATTFSGKATSAGSADSAATVSVTSTNTSANYNLAFVSGTSGNNQIYVAGANSIKVNPSTKIITAAGYTVSASSFSGNVDVTKNSNFGTASSSAITIGKSGINTTINGSTITIAGNLNIQGTTTTIDTATLSTKDNLIELAKGNTAALTTPAGFYVNKYDGTNSGALVFDSTGTAYVGDVTISNGNISASTSLQPLATRDKSLTDGSILKWDNTKKTLVKATNLTDTAYASSNHNHNSSYITGVSVSNDKITYTLNGTSKEAGTVNNVAAASSATNATNATNVALSASVTTNATDGDSVTIKAGNKTGATFTIANAKYANTAGMIKIEELGNTINQDIPLITRAPTTTTDNYNHVAIAGSLLYNPSINRLTATEFDGTASNIKIATASNKSGLIPFAYADNTLGSVSNFNYDSSTSILTVNGVTINGASKVITATTFSGKATSAGSADSATRATNIAVDANNSNILNVALLNVSAASTTTKPLVATTNKLSYNAATGNISALQVGVKSAGSDTSPKAYMKYNSTEECIEFIFA